MVTLKEILELIVIEAQEGQQDEHRILKPTVSIWNTFLNPFCPVSRQYHGSLLWAISQDSDHQSSRTRQRLGGRVQEYFWLILYLFKFIFKATQRGENIHLVVEGAGAEQSFFKITILVEKNEIWLTSLPWRLPGWSYRWGDLTFISVVLFL